MDNVFDNIIFLPMLGYFQLLKGYFLLFKIIPPYIIYGFIIILNFFGYFVLFLAISNYLTLSYFQLLLIIFGYSKLFHVRLFSVM
jgi:hypothetical protein